MWMFFSHTHYCKLLIETFWLVHFSQKSNTEVLMITTKSSPKPARCDPPHLLRKKKLYWETLRYTMLFLFQVAHVSENLLAIGKPGMHLTSKYLNKRTHCFIKRMTNRWRVAQREGAHAWHMQNPGFNWQHSTTSWASLGRIPQNND